MLGVDGLTPGLVALAVLAIAALAWGAWALLVPLAIGVVLNWEELHHGRVRPARTRPTHRP
jgi:hypothetical protein